MGIHLKRWKHQLVVDRIPTVYHAYYVTQRRYDVYAIIEIPRLVIPLGALLALSYFYVQNLHDVCTSPLVWPPGVYFVGPLRNMLNKNKNVMHLFQSYSVMVMVPI